MRTSNPPALLSLARKISRHRTSLLAALLVFATALTSIPPAHGESRRAKRKAEKAALADLSDKYKQWLEAVDLIITRDEKSTFLTLAKDYQRDAFIEQFWKVRDPYPGSARNEYRDDYNARIEHALSTFGRLDDDRTRVLLTNGPPLARVEADCTPSLWPMEVWQYKGSDTYSMEFLLLFYQRDRTGPFRLWEPIDGLERLQSVGFSAQGSFNVGGFFGDCGLEADAVRAAVSFVNGQGGPLGASTFFSRLLEPRTKPPAEWTATFETYSTDLPEGAETFEAEVDLDYPGRRQSRSILQIGVSVTKEQITPTVLGEGTSYHLMLNGEILREGQLFDTFRYKFDFPAATVPGDSLPLVAQRYLRPGKYQMILKVEDVTSGKLFRTERDLEVPQLQFDPPPEPEDPETARILAEANNAIRTGENTVQIAPLGGRWQTGLVRIDALTTGSDIAKVTFLLDDQAVLTKRTPPFNVELDLGDVPRSRVLRVEAFDAEENEIASDEVMLNAGPHRFAVRLEEPRRGKTYIQSLRAEANVLVPEGEVVDRVELYLNETLLSTLYQEPFIQPIILPEAEAIAYVRAVAYTPDGRATEDLVFINAPADLEEIDVDFVELYTAVLDRQKRPVEGLEKSDFTVLEDQVPQEILRFEQVRNLPIHVAVMVDTSASMQEEIQETQAAALEFLESAIQHKDRAAVVTFNDHPHLAAKFTSDPGTLASGLAGLKAERGTALYDSLIFCLYYFNGIKGQRAILLLSDGKDESSRFEFEEALDYARRAGVSIYAIGLQLSKKGLDAKRKLNKLVEETGGRSFFIDDISELSEVYATIQQELRSRYLIAYQSNNTSGSKRFRTIEVELPDGSLEAKTLKGYYP